MAKMLITKSLLTSIANAIRSKTGKTDAMTPAQMVTEIESISGGGGATLQDRIDDTITTFSSDSESIPVSLFRNSTGIQELSFRNIITIPNSLCYGATNLNKFSAPNATTVAAYAFRESGLSNIDSSLTTIGNQAFYDCINLTELDTSKIETIGTWAFRGTSFPSFEAPNVKSLGEAAFCACEKLESASFGPISTIPNKAFLACTSFKNANFAGNIISVGDYAFQECPSLESFDFNAVTNIGSHAFDGTNIKGDLEIPTEVVINEGAFSNCKNLKTVTLSGWKSIGVQFRSLFDNAGTWKISFPNLTTIGVQYFFTSAYEPTQSSLQLVEFPKLTKSSYQPLNGLKDGIKVFDMLGSSTNKIPSDSDGLFNKYSGTAPNFEAWIIRQSDGVQPIATDAKIVCGRGSKISNGTGYIYVPSALISDYEAATNWASLAGQFRAIEDYTVDGTLTGDMDYDKMGVTFDD